MSETTFHHSRFFSVDEFPFKDIFVKSVHVWDVLPSISGYVLSLIHSGTLQKNYSVTDTVIIGNGSVIEEGVKIIGPAIIGRNCLIRHGALIRENVLIGDNVTIGHAVELKNSVVLNNAAIAHLSYVGDSIIGNGVNISGGAMTANFRLDKKTIRIQTGKNFIDSGLTKFGAIIGDGSVIGVNAVLNPGTVLGKNTQVYPLREVKGVHPENAKIK